MAVGICWAWARDCHCKSSYNGSTLPGFTPDELLAGGGSLMRSHSSRQVLDKHVSGAHWMDCCELVAMKGKKKQKWLSALSSLWEQKVLAQGLGNFVTLGHATSCCSKSEKRSGLRPKWLKHPVLALIAEWASRRSFWALDCFTCQMQLKKSAALKSPLILWIHTISILEFIVCIWATTFLI